MSRTNRLLITAVTFVAIAALPSRALAQRGGHGGGHAPAQAVVIAPYYPYYSPFYSPFYDPFFLGFGWSYPGWYGPYAYASHAVEESSARLQVTPKETEVYVDGYLAGIVDDFDGVTQRLNVPPGEHAIELYLEGHKPVTQTILFQRGKTIRIKHTMEALAAGEPAPARPSPKPGAPPPTQYDAFGQPMGDVAAVPASAKSGTLAIRVQPSDATVIVDGEPWQNSGDRLDIQTSPGEHRIEVQRDGYQPFSTSVRVKSGELSRLNVSLTKSGEMR